MTKAVIFGGTAEGRELAEFCADNRILAVVSVVSEYGRRLLPDGPDLMVHCGAMGEEEMEQFLLSRRPELVLDATHPYAAVVSECLARVCEKQKLTYFRVVREERKSSRDFCVITVPDAAEAAAILKNDLEKVFVTTGSKELEVFTAIPEYKERIYARVLPDSRVIAGCERLGISGKHLIAMQGPFSEELNRAMLVQTGARWLVTKDSGSRGGFEEKLLAAEACQASVIVIGRPVKETGITLAQAKKRLLVYAKPGKRSLSLIGMGMGGAGQMTLEAAEALEHCQAVLGAPRMLADAASKIRGKRTEKIYLGAEILDWLEKNPQYRSVGVLYSGDTGFYSGSSLLIEKLKQENRQNEWDVTVCPGISTVSGLCARLKTSWESIYLGSIHGRSADVPELLNRHPRVFLLLGGSDSVKHLAGILSDAGYGNVRITVGERLGYEDERICTGTASQMRTQEFDPLSAVLLERTQEDER